MPCRKVVTKDCLKTEDFLHTINKYEHNTDFSFGGEEKAEVNAAGTGASTGLNLNLAFKHSGSNLSDIDARQVRDSHNEREREDHFVDGTSQIYRDVIYNKIQITDFS